MLNWPEFLQQWNRELLASPLAGQLPNDLRASGWLGRPPATERQIADAEARLGIALPPTYRAFLRVSNGWGRTTAFIDEIWSASQVNWFRKANRDWIAAYSTPAQWGPGEEPPAEAYFAYGEHSSHFKPSHLKDTLQISPVGDAAVYLLNPQVISKDGEWEAWFFANWLPGARRFRSFAELMESEYHTFAGTEWTQPIGVTGELPDEFTGAPGSPKRRLKKRSPRREPKVLGKPASKWTVDELLGFLNNPEFDIIHGEVIYGLEMLGDPRAIDPLFALVDKSDTLAAAAAHALLRLAPDRLPPALLERFQRDRGRSLSAHGIASLLAKLGIVEAIPILIAIMHDHQPEMQYFREIAAQTIAQFGQAGFDALVGLLDNPNPQTRARAANGLLSTNRPEARAIFERLASDADPAMRQFAEIALDVLPRPRRPGR